MFLLTLVVVFIVDVSGFIQNIRPALNVKLGRDSDKSLKPFDCSLCLTFWVGMFYAMLAGFTVRHVAFVCLCAFGAQFIAEGIFILKDFLAAVVRVLSDKIEKYGNSKN